MGINKQRNCVGVAVYPLKSRRDSSMRFGHFTIFGLEGGNLQIFGGKFHCCNKNEATRKKGKNARTRLPQTRNGIDAMAR
jgi:hypothetical protein